MSASDNLGDRIASAALELFLAQGIRKTSVEDVAGHIGVSRMTVYRYYPDKHSLVREAFLRIARLFEVACEDIRREAAGGVEPALDRVFRYFSDAPHGPILGRLDELRRVYPDVFEEYRRIRNDALNGIFDSLRDTLAARDLLRPGLNEAVVRIVFLDALLNILDNPALKELRAPAEEIYTTLRTVLLHGILRCTQEEPGCEQDPRREQQMGESR